MNSTFFPSFCLSRSWGCRLMWNLVQVLRVLWVVGLCPCPGSQIRHQCQCSLWLPSIKFQAHRDTVWFNINDWLLETSISMREMEERWQQQPQLEFLAQALNVCVKIQMCIFMYMKIQGLSLTHHCPPQLSQLLAEIWRIIFSPCSPMMWAQWSMGGNLFSLPSVSCCYSSTSSSIHKNIFACF